MQGNYVHKYAQFVDYLIDVLQAKSSTFEKDGFSVVGDFYRI